MREYRMAAKSRHHWTLLSLTIQIASKGDRLCSVEMRVQMYTEEDFQSGGLSPVPSRINIIQSKPRFRRNQFACDSCHLRRVRCDLVSSSPCSRCLRTGMNCGLSRPLRKRGRTARSNLGNGTTRREQCHSPKHIQPQQANNSFAFHSPSTASPMSPTTPASATNTWSPPTNEIDTLLALCTDDHHSPSGTSREWEMPDVESTDDCLAMGTLPKELSGSISQDEGPRQPLAGSWDWDFDGSHDLSHEQFPTLSLPEEGLSGAAGKTMVQYTLRYPVLSSIMITLEPHISFQFACHLLELYFSERSSTNAHAIYGHVPCSLLRKASFLTDDFRPTSPALLASMLWMAAVDYGHCSVSISPSQQTNICQLLRNTTFWFLSVSKDGECKNVEPLLSGSFAHTMARDPLNRTGDLDDVITYIHIASIISNEQSSSSKSWYVPILFIL